MKTIKTIKFDIGLRDFATEKEVTLELIKEYIETEAPGVYTDLKISEGGLYYTSDEDEGYTSKINTLISTLNLF